MQHPGGAGGGCQGPRQPRRRPPTPGPGALTCKNNRSLLVADWYFNVLSDAARESSLDRARRHPQHVSATGSSSAHRTVQANGNAPAARRRAQSISDFRGDRPGLRRRFGARSAGARGRPATPARNPEDTDEPHREDRPHATLPRSPAFSPITTRRSAAPITSPKMRFGQDRRPPPGFEVTVSPTAAGTSPTRAGPATCETDVGLLASAAPAGRRPAPFDVRRSTPGACPPGCAWARAAAIRWYGAKSCTAGAGHESAPAVLTDRVPSRAWRAPACPPRHHIVARSKQTGPAGRRLLSTEDNSVSRLRPAA